MTPPPALVDRFASDLHALAGPLAPGARLGLAVSGGPDSLALLILAQAANPGRVEAATVDHGLRPEALAEAEAVAGLCRELGVPHATLPAQVAGGGEGLQANARHARYRALDDWLAERGLSFLLTAHHADDRAETLLMRLARGSGVSGLAGVRPRAPVPGGAGTLLRPFLGWRRAELAAVVRAAGINPATDPSNADPAFDRARLRAHLAQAPWLDAEPLARSAGHLADADAALAWAADRLWAERAQLGGGECRLDTRDLPDEFVLRLVRRALVETGGTPAPRGGELGRLARGLARGETRTLAGVRCKGDPVWRFSPAPPHRR